MVLKVVIAEDEQSAREGLIRSIDWPLYGMEICGVAENGRQALELIKRDSPDLLLTDIRMPYLNGLELIRTAKAFGASFHSVLITGFDKFEYAREAIALGVSDYILKPFMPNDIVRVIMDVKQKMKASGLASAQPTEFNRAWSRNIHLLKNQILSQWIRQPLLPLENRDSAISEAQLSLRPEPIELGIVRMDAEIGSAAVPASIKDLELIRYAVQNIVNESLLPFYGGYVEVFRHEEDLLWIGNSPSTGTAQDREAMMRNVQQNLEDYLKLSFSLSLSSPHRSADFAQPAYQQSLEAMKGRFYRGKGGIFLHSQASGEQDASLSILDDLFLHRWEKELIIFLRQEYYEHAVDTIHSGIRYLKDQPRYTRSEVILRLTGLVLVLLKFKEEHFPEPAGACAQGQAHESEQQSRESRKQGEGIDWIEIIAKAETLDECSAILQRVVQRIVIAASGRKVLHRTVRAAIEFIKDNYNTNVTLELAAKETFVSNSYLSSLFKQELGVNFLDFLHQYRVERAKELLRKNYKIYAVSKMIGYHNERHFSATFKKWTGSTPQQYQKKHERV
ncbi:response regulator [Paenibacillus sp. NPDC058071]|uniref:response regulator n=1 Tax=Paenibacillus sp. NPDC058071 TaxID=3346326 RepID=UPI0036DAB517